ncbi:MAG: hypothetical protein VYD54_08485 [Bdellovibrionota bacterium]|nr:hypothetical protein [Bdellovibrionota bacterium]
MFGNFSYDKCFWKVLTYLDNLEEKISVEELCLILNVKSELIYKGIQFFERFNIEYKFVKKGEKTFIYPHPSQINISLSLSLTEWLNIENYLPSKETEENFLVKKLGIKNNSDPSNKKVDRNFFEILEYEKKKEKLLVKMASDNGHQYGVICQIEKALRENQMTLLNLTGSKSEEVFPRSLSYVDGQICFIGEERKDRCLVYINTSEIKSVKANCPGLYKKNFGLKEVNDFINSLRFMGGKEMRLVLKFKTNNIDLTPPIKFYDQPYVTYVPDGGLIWSASVELNNELFEWLVKNEELVEILDPQFLKSELKEFISYKEPSFKKAS